MPQSGPLGVGSALSQSIEIPATPDLPEGRFLQPPISYCLLWGSSERWDTLRTLYIQESAGDIALLLPPWGAPGNGTASQAACCSKPRASRYLRTQVRI
jgi:hypothetical protein